jgi:hypothetical protein
MHAALTNKILMNGIKQASPFDQTSCLEGFHSVLNQFSPKMIGTVIQACFAGKKQFGSYFCNIKAG